jgi:F-type H+-transporting ATPase subunit epsilon
MSGVIRLSVLSPDGEAFAAACDAVTLPALDGSIGIMKGHAHMVAALKAGTGHYTIDGVKHDFTVLPGLAEVSDDTVVIVMDAAGAGKVSL